MLPRTKNDKARQILAVYLLARTSAHMLANSRQDTTACFLLIQQILSEFDPADVAKCSTAEAETSIPDWAEDLVIKLIEAYRDGKPARELWELVDVNIVGGESDLLDPPEPPPGKIPKELGEPKGDHPTAPPASSDRPLVAAARQWWDKFRSGQSQNSPYGYLANFPAIGADPVVGILGPVGEHVQSCVKTTQVMGSGHVFEMMINFKTQRADYTLWPPYYGPCTGRPALMHGTIILGEDKGLDSMWFANIAASILAMATADLKKAFELYRRPVNNAENS